MAKRKCRMTEHEIDIHKRAVALRKMTDEQLVDTFNGVKKKFRTEIVDVSDAHADEAPTVLIAKSISDEQRKALIKAHEESTEPLTVDSGRSVDILLSDLKSNKVKGVGKVTAEKIIDYCIERGYSKYGIYEMG